MPGESPLEGLQHFRHVPWREVLPWPSQEKARTRDCSPLMCFHQWEAALSSMKTVQAEKRIEHA